MFGTLGGPELLLIFVIALIVFGPRKLPEIGKSVGKMMAEFRKASNDFKQTIESEVEAEKLHEAVRVDPFTPSPSSTPSLAPSASAKAGTDLGQIGSAATDENKEPEPPTEPAAPQAAAEPEASQAAPLLEASPSEPNTVARSTTPSA